MEDKSLNINDKPVCFVGLACLDIFMVIKSFPSEDSNKRCEDCIWQRGGNASNSAVVYSSLGGKCSFYGTLADTSLGDFMTDHLTKHNVSFTHCKRIPNSSCPTSVVILNESNGSRTILHTNKNLKELTLEDFAENKDVTEHNFGWVHFEGRDNCVEIDRMIKFVVDLNKRCDNPSDRIIISFEVEKVRLVPYMKSLDLWNMPDVLFVSKDYAMNDGLIDMKSAVEMYSEKVQDGAIVICAWGEQGAAAKSAKEGVVTSPAFPPSKVIDTCGAGDTFNATVIWALASGESLQKAITLGCKVAGKKCGLQGFDGLKNAV